jgi:hypothetical protein
MEEGYYEKVDFDQIANLLDRGMRPGDSSGAREQSPYENIAGCDSIIKPVLPIFEFLLTMLSFDLHPPEKLFNFAMFLLAEFLPPGVGPAASWNIRGDRNVTRSSNAVSLRSLVICFPSCARAIGVV